MKVSNHLIIWTYKISILVSYISWYVNVVRMSLCIRTVLTLILTILSLILINCTYDFVFVTVRRKLLSVMDESMFFPWFQF